MKQFVLFFLSLFLLTVGARSQEAYQKKVFISSRGRFAELPFASSGVGKAGAAISFGALSARCRRAGERQRETIDTRWTDVSQPREP